MTNDPPDTGLETFARLATQAGASLTPGNAEAAAALERVEPSTFAIYRPGTYELLVKLTETGNLVYGPTYHPDEAAKLFWSAMRSNSDTAAALQYAFLTRRHAAEGAATKIERAKVETLATLIADEIAAQDNEIDNLGDGESIVLNGKLPCINLMQLAERILTGGPAENTAPMGGKEP